MCKDIIFAPDYTTYYGTFVQKRYPDEALITLPGWDNGGVFMCVTHMDLCMFGGLFLNITLDTRRLYRECQP